MSSDLKKKLMAGGMVMALAFGGLAGCGDGVDDGQQDDEMDEKNEETE